jgi:hypothetical protein
MSSDLKSVVRLVATLNLAYFGIEFAVATAIASMSLFADSVDFLEDGQHAQLRQSAGTVDGHFPKRALDPGTAASRFVRNAPLRPGWVETYRLGIGLLKVRKLATSQR